MEGKMIIERRNGELVVKIPDRISASAVQEILDYLEAVSLIRKSRASEKEIDRLSENLSREWWRKNKSRFVR
jgi:hypothetical protein